jgi:hypothetical protein
MLEADETLGLMYENENTSLIRITSHGFQVNNVGPTSEA